MWTITANQHAIPKNTLDRSREYKNNSSHSGITELSLRSHSYPNVTYHISVKAASSQQYNQLKITLISRGFPEPDYLDSHLKYYSLKCNDLSILAAFLTTIKTVEASFAEIEQDVCDTFHIDLSQEVVMPRWIKSGNFKSTSESNGSFNCFTEYSSAGLSITKIALLASSDGNRNLLLKTSAQEYSRLIQIITAAGFPEPVCSDKITHTYSFDTANQDRFNRFISTIDTFCDLSEIKNDIQASFDSAIQNSRSAPLQNPNTLGRRPYTASSDSVAPLRPLTDSQIEDILDQLIPEQPAPPKRDFVNVLSAGIFATKTSFRPVSDIGSNAKNVDEMNHQGDIPEEFEKHNAQPSSFK